MGGIAFEKAIDPEKMRRLLEAQCNITGIAARIIDSAGMVLISTGNRDACVNFHSTHSVTNRRCQETLSQFQDALKQENPCMRKCPNGLFESAFSIFIQGEPAATLFLGPFRLQEELPPFSVFVSQAAEFGFDADSYVKAIHRTRVISIPQIKDILEYCKMNVDLMIELSLKNIQMCRQLYEQSKVERRLRDSEDFYSSLVDHIPQRIFRKDMDGRFTYADSSFCASVARKREEILGKTDYDFYPKAMADKFRRDDLEVMHSGKSSEAIEENRTPEGATIIVQVITTPILDGNGNIKGVQGIFWDITESKRVENELLESRRMLQMVLDTIPVRVFWKDTNLVYLGCNRPFAADAGVGTPEEVIGQNDYQLSWVDQAELYQSDDRHVLETGEPKINYEEPQSYPDGRKIVLRTSKIPLRDKDDKIVGILGVYEDITDKVRAGIERRKLEAQVQHAQKLESLGVLAGGIAHDFNNLLMSILGNADLALMKLSSVAPARDNVLDIEKASRRAADLCRQMLAYSGKGRFIVEPIDLSEIVKEMAHMLEVAISKKAALKYSFPPELPAVEADATQVCQVIMNLITNASEALGDKNGVISISTGSLHCDRNYLNQSHMDTELAEGVYSYIEVSDTGCGMNQETRARIFDPFFTTKFTGRGLGLAAVLGIMRGHNGAIKVYTEAGKGSTFKVLFPVTATLKSVAKDEAESNRGWRGSGTVLLADDEEGVCMVGRQMLEILGFIVLTASDGASTLRMFHAHRDEIVCILLDLTMPYMDGEEAFRELRHLKPGLPVIICSGYNEQEVTQRFLGKGLAGFLQKPYQFKDLAKLMRAILEQPADPPETCN